MSEKQDSLQKQLEQFGFNQAEAQIYLFLLKVEQSTPLKISKDLKIARTKVYRVLDELVELGFVFEIVEGYGKKYGAESPEKIFDLINKKQREVLLLKTSASTLVNQLNTLKPMLKPNTKILHYRGVEGLKQVVWNSTKSKDTFFRIYEFGYSLEAFLDKEFAERVRREFVKNKTLHYRQLTNLKEINTDTDVKDMIDRWEVRYLSKEKLDIKIEIQIFNDVYALYEYSRDDVFIVEIYDQDLARMQKQIYDLIWESAIPLKKLNNRGSAALD